ncbi:hypothetical protein C8A03DRAFT_34297 [Achaetomium macrosporum]|uniref:Uncharacterized protein n=1 Tax=Achaetomium macrosporum TaxID=79813 RepID=A0AAN7C9M9_9PEZI|nr:hypothetical protein C8A03DRAFT_34297 [Achaetomium macrosporum]
MACDFIERDMVAIGHLAVDNSFTEVTHERALDSFNKVSTRTTTLSASDPPTTCTRQDEHRVLQDSVGHHRVVAYRFGGLRLVVQSEVDGYYCDRDDGHSAAVSAPPSSPPPGPFSPRY